MSRKRKRHTEETKGRVALEAIEGVRALSDLSATYGMYATVIAQWKRRLIRPPRCTSGENGEESGEGSGRDRSL